MQARMKFRTLLTAMVVSLALPAWALRFVTEDSPPFSMTENDEVTGISSLIVREALKRSSIDGHFQILPWARAQFLARKQADTCMYSAVRTPQREPHYLWIGPLAEDQIALFARQGSPVQLTSLADARRYRVGSYIGDAYGNYVESQGVPLDRASTDANNLPKLMSGHIELWVAGSMVGTYRARQAGLGDRVRLALVVPTSDSRITQVWLACNLGMDRPVFNKLRDAVNSVRQDGTAAAIAARYK